jgi:2'-5' RNA ligase
MYSYFLALPLPPIARARLATFCYGLSQVRWVEEENFYLILRQFGPLTSQVLTTIHERLENLFFLPFSLVLQGVGHYHAKGNRGTLWMGVAHPSPLISLRKEIDRHLRDVQLRPDERSFHPHVILGFYERLDPQRLGDYLITHGDYQSWPIEVTSCLLLRSLQTSKHTIYEVIEEYLASQLATGED